MGGIEGWFALDKGAGTAIVLFLAFLAIMKWRERRRK
jgi:hypothetical protein